MTFELEFLDGKRAVPRQLLSYRWSGDVTAGCDGLRLHFLWDGDLPEVYRVRGFAPDGACCFFGYADQQKLTVTPGQRRGFVYARSSACLLLDNEALPISLNAPNVDQMVHHYAAPFGFTAALPAGTAPGQYTVEKGTSCFGALQGFMQVLGAKGVFVDPENRLCVYGSETPVTLPGDQITSITAVTERGEAPGVYAYKIASAEPYCRRLEAGYFADKKISRRRYVNVYLLSTSSLVRSTPTTALFTEQAASSAATAAAAIIVLTFAINTLIISHWRPACRAGASAMAAPQGITATKLAKNRLTHKKRGGKIARFNKM